MSNAPEIVLKLQEWRGYSAYELAVKYGFEGTEQEWIDSLKWGDLKVIVCGKELDDNGEIILYGSDIRVVEGGLYTIAEKIQQLDEGKLATDDVVDSLESADTKKALSAAKGRELNAAVLTKAEVFMAELNIPTSGWSTEEPYTKELDVYGITENSAVMLADYPDGGENEEAFVDCGLKLISKRNNKVTVRVDNLPEKSFKANILVMIPGVRA